MVEKKLRNPRDHLKGRSNYALTIDEKKNLGQLPHRIPLETDYPCHTGSLTTVKHDGC